MATRRTSELQIRLVLTDSIKLARRIETTPRLVVGKDQHRILTLAFLSRARRLAQIVRGIPADLLPEAQPTVRSLFELATNLQWILLKDKRRRANRFIQFEPVENMRLYNENPESMSSAAFEEKAKENRKALRRVAHLFRIRTRKGKLIWAKSWGKDNFRERLDEVLADLDAVEGGKSSLVFQYKYYSGMAHGSVGQLGRLLQHDRKGRITTKQKSPSNDFTALGLTIGYLHNITFSTVRELEVPYIDEISKLNRRHHRLLDNLN